MSILEPQCFGQISSALSWDFQADMDLLNFYRFGVHENPAALIFGSHLEITILPRKAGTVTA
jgi:hypothetical protein